MQPGGFVETHNRQEAVAGVATFHTRGCREQGAEFQLLGMS
jgi:hypothetical protein